MTTKTTLDFSKLKSTYFIVLVLCLFAGSNLFAQTVTNVSPTRVTTKTVVTIIGSGFTSTTLSSIAISSNTISISDRKLISSTEMTFEISYLSTSADRVGNLFVDGVDTGFDISYVHPTQRQMSNNSNNVEKVSEIFTTYNHDGSHFWKSSQWKTQQTNNNLKPNDHHDLLAFTYGGITYSTGVDDAKLTANEVDFEAQNFQAYSSNGVAGYTHSASYLCYGDLIDGTIGEDASITSQEILGSTIFNSIIDGVNGLDLGTGITNFNQNTSVRFFSGNGQVGAIDEVPDLLLTQIADPGSDDIYYYADENGNVVGRPIKLRMVNEGNGTGLLAPWRLDLWRFTNNDAYDVATPIGRGGGSNEERDIRMVAFKLQEFGIDASNIEDIGNINMVAGGTADIAFIAYNKNAFDIKSPKVIQYPLSRFICKFPNTSTVVFNTIVEIDGGASTPEDPKEALFYEWFKYNIATGESSNEYTLPGSGIVPNDLGTYKVKIHNEYGTVILPVTLAEGGTPATWNGTTFQLPQAYIDAGISVDAADRSLSFASNYNEVGDIEGCDCKVPAGRTVIIPSGSSITLYDELSVDPAIPGESSEETIDEGIFILEDNASLIQTKAVTANQNSGSIKMKREASGLHQNDYVYWSSPVANFNISNISNTPTYEWHVNAMNPQGTAGNWISASGSTMAPGRGYIVRVPNATTFTTTFEGKPNNGTISMPVEKSSTGALPETESRHWNLVGNPYPSAISADKFLEANTRLDGNVRIWTHNRQIADTVASPYYQNFVYNYGDQYVTHNGTGSTPSNSFDGNIAAGQGFFVQVEESQSNGDINFTNAMRYGVNESVLDNSEFFRNNNASATSDAIEKQLIWLSLIKEGNTAASALIGYVEGATLDKDRLYDTYSNGANLSISSMIGNKQMVIQGRPLPFTNTDEVPLGVTIPQNGIYKIALDNLEGSIFTDDSQGVYVEDTYLNVVHDLRQSPYTFTGETETLTDRFVLRYTPDETLAINETMASETFAYIKNSHLQVRSSQHIQAIQVYDLNGKQIADYTTKHSSNSFSADFQFARGVYLAVITLDNDLTIKKKLMN